MDSTRICTIASLPCNEPDQDKERTGLVSKLPNRFFFWLVSATAVIRRKPARAFGGCRHGSLHDLGSGAPFALFFSSPKKRQIIYRKKSKIVKIYQYSKNIENKLKYFKKCVDKCTTLYYIKLNKRETEQPNREGWERSTKESIEREV